MLFNIMLTIAKWIRFFFMILILAAVSGCTKSAPASSSTISAPLINTPFQPLAWTVTPAPTTAPTTTLSPTPLPYSLWIDPALPELLRSQIKLPADYSFASTRDGATIRIEFSAKDVMSQWVFVLVAPFPTIMDVLRSWMRPPGKI
jgi:hypothetical protein